jgi:hypothetical protein
MFVRSSLYLSGRYLDRIEFSRQIYTNRECGLTAAHQAGHSTYRVQSILVLNHLTSFVVV